MIYFRCKDKHLSIQLALLVMIASSWICVTRWEFLLAFKSRKWSSIPNCPSILYTQLKMNLAQNTTHKYSFFRFEFFYKYLPHQHLHDLRQKRLLLSGWEIINLVLFSVSLSTSSNWLLNWCNQVVLCSHQLNGPRLCVSQFKIEMCKKVCYNNSLLMLMLLLLLLLVLLLLLRFWIGSSRHHKPA